MDLFLSPLSSFFFFFAGQDSAGLLRSLAAAAKERAAASMDTAPETRGCRSRRIGSSRSWFPYEPYSLQTHAVDALREYLDERSAGAGQKHSRTGAAPELRLAVLESPTGTGKSHMLLAAALSHMFDVALDPQEADSAAASTATRGPGPMAGSPLPQPQPPLSLAEAVEAAKQRENAEALDAGDPQAALRCMRRKQRRQARALASKWRHLAATARQLAGDDGAEDGDAALLLEQDPGELLREFQSECPCMALASPPSSGSSSSSSSRSSSEAHESTEEGGGWASVARCVPLRRPKLYLASRTHTQLEQMRCDLQDTVFAQYPVRSRLLESGERSPHPLVVVHVASRAQLCINSCIKRRAGGGPAATALLNDACADAMQFEMSSEGRKARRLRAETGGPQSPSRLLHDIEDAAAGCGPLYADRGCPFAVPSRLRALAQYLQRREHIAAAGAGPGAGAGSSLSLSLDEMVSAGRALGACPYLVTRLLLRGADVVLLPHAYLTDEEQRQPLLGGAATNPIREEEREELEGGLVRRHVDAVSAAAALALEDGQRAAALASRLPPDCRGDVLVLDEAHHLAEQCLAVSTCAVSEPELGLAAASLRCYAERYRTRLLAVNKQRLRELAWFIDHAHEWLQRRGGAASEASYSDFVFDAGVDHVDLHPLREFLLRSRLVYKLRGVLGLVVGRHNDRDEQTVLRWLMHHTGPPMPQQHDPQPQVTPAGHLDEAACGRLVGTALRRVSLFLRWCELSGAHTRVFTAPGAAPGQMELQLLQLEPGAHTLLPLLRQVDGAVLAGGTMRPLPLSLYPLLPAACRGCPSLEDAARRGSQQPGSAVHRGRGGWCLVSEPHVVPPTSLQVWALPAGPGGTAWNFSQQALGGAAGAAYTPQERQTFLDLAAALLNLSRVSPPAGVICFVPSYRFQYRLLRFLRDVSPRGLQDDHGAAPLSFEQQIAAGKKIFSEVILEEDGAGQPGSEPGTAKRPAEDLMAAYKAWMDAGSGRTRGALLVAVLGGKLSEGLNFADDLARMVLVVGLPYGNPNDAVTTNFFQHIAQQSSGGTASPSVFSLYTDMCMRSVNQAIGRCIRHRGDFAVAILMDSRYATRSRLLADGLSAWMQPSIRVASNFGECFRGVRAFFADHTHAATHANSRAGSARNSGGVLLEISLQIVVVTLVLIAPVLFHPTSLPSYLPFSLSLSIYLSISILYL
eukprot:gene8572-6013_t